MKYFTLFSILCFINCSRKNNLPVINKLDLNIDTSNIIATEFQNNVFDSLVLKNPEVMIYNDHNFLNGFIYNDSLYLNLDDVMVEMQKNKFQSEVKSPVKIYQDSISVKSLLLKYNRPNLKINRLFIWE